MIESVLQIHILTCLSISNERFKYDTDHTWFLITLTISVFNGGFGITKFLKTGPCQIIPRSSGFINGYVSLGLPPLVLSIIATLLGKGFMLAIVASDFGQGGLKFTKVVMWVGLNWIPSLIYVSQDILIAF